MGGLEHRIGQGWAIGLGLAFGWLLNHGVDKGWLLEGWLGKWFAR
jgi:hypothetical protein